MKKGTGMNPRWTLCAVMLFALFTVSAAEAAPPVTGSGSVGRVPKWVNTTELGDSSISEDGAGHVAIGTIVNPGITLNVYSATQLGMFVGTSGSHPAFYARSSHTGVGGETSNGTGVVGTTDNITSFRFNTAVLGSSQTGDGVFGRSTSKSRNSAAVLGFGVTGGALAGMFAGDVDVFGTLWKAGGSFKIDHPLDPENRYLYHSFVESPDMKNIYDGVLVLDYDGEATVELPEWFQALNRDFRYLLTPIGAPAPGLHIAEEIADNRFRVAGGVAGMKVSWQVTGIRQDAWARKNRIPIEEQKAEGERGYYLHPEALGQPEERGIEWVREAERSHPPSR